ncbi:MAG TPA: GNAT family N-acetyltransferase [Solirubrobacteraceae bacterium]|nr:GNAT family N-acetyltransferase [Solirubrobacteraceae bacterium]
MYQSHQTSDVGLEFLVPPGIGIRPLEPSDRAGVAALFKRLSPESRRQRFLGPKPRLSDRELTYLTTVDHRWHEALAAVDRRDGSIVGVARYVRVPERPDAADGAIAVADEHHGRGIGTALLRCLIARARVNRFSILTATTLWENRPARALLRGAGFQARGSSGAVIDLELEL